MISPLLAPREPALEKPGHPWLDPPSGTPLGKAAHVSALARAQVALDSTMGPGWPPSVQPLLSQPVTELCLSIPSWRWIAGGRNRSVARMAFASSLPETLLNRRTKGGPDAFSIEALESNRGQISEMLGDGVLARNRLIQPGRVSAALGGDRAIQPPTNIHLIRLIAAEAWVRSWTARTYDLRAA